ncbi:MAG: hypothetical protein CVU64_07860 [Deltaproteobacteria bacterium HGW-Deltaproteobacteria-21]|nr:MAG: hypothetical protein CVU64_07860 [Deltaproteobacteria bacterium HGW-Deltaproteobacteria-21]
MMLTAGGQATIIFALIITIVGSKVYNGHMTRFAIPGMGITILLMSFIGISILSGVCGLASRNDLSFVTGDIFKFTAFPIAIVLAYENIVSVERLDKLLYLTLIFYALFLLKDLLQYKLGLLDVNERSLSIYMYPFMPLIATYLKSQGLKHIRALQLFYILCFPIFVFYTQSLTLVLLTGFLLGASWLFHRGLTLKATKRIVLCTAVISASLAFSIWGGVGFVEKYSENPRTGYLLRKFVKMEAGLQIRTLELVAGDRVAQIVAVLKYFNEKPLRILTGQGMGGWIKVRSVTGLKDVTWKETNHNIESGYPEVMLRTGIIGLMIYIGIFVAIFLYAFRLRKKNYFLSMAAAYSLYILIFSFLNMPFIGQGFGSLYMLSIIVSGTWLYHRRFRRTPEEPPARPCKDMLVNE